ncbi:hypothetical protein DPMN_022024, partial [Dreissena polymorpha]
MPGKRKRQAYDNAFKIRVIEFADNLNINSAAEGEFGISEKLVGDWRKNKDTIYTESTGYSKLSTEQLHQLDTECAAVHISK